MLFGSGMFGSVPVVLVGAVTILLFLLGVAGGSFWTGGEYLAGLAFSLTGGWWLSRALGTWYASRALLALLLASGALLTFAAWPSRGWGFPFGNPNLMGGYLLFPLGAGISLWREAADGREKRSGRVSGSWLIAAGLIVVTAGFWRADSLLSQIAALFLVGLLGSRGRWRYYFPLVLLGMAAGGVYLYQAGNVSLSSRVAMARETWRLSLDSCWWGHGPGSFPAWFSPAVPATFWGVPGVASFVEDPHNLLLRILFEYGGAGVVVVLAGGGGMLFRGVRRGPEALLPLSLALALLVNGCGSVVLSYPLGQLVGCFAFFSCLVTEEDPPELRRAGGRALAAVLSLSGLAILGDWGYREVLLHRSHRMEERRQWDGAANLALRAAGGWLPGTETRLTALVQAARMHCGAGHFTEALKVLEEAEILRPGAGDLGQIRGEILRAAGQEELALLCFWRRAVTNPFAPGALSLLMQSPILSRLPRDTALSRHLLHDVETSLRLVVPKRPQEPSYPYLMAGVCFLRGDESGARRWLEQTERVCRFLQEKGDPEGSGSHYLKLAGAARSVRERSSISPSP